MIHGLIQRKPSIASRRRRGDIRDTRDWDTRDWGKLLMSLLLAASTFSLRQHGTFFIVGHFSPRRAKNDQQRGRIVS
jgi:hypothetical protein